MLRVELIDNNGNKVVVPMFQLLQWKHAINLERVGLRHSRGSVTQHVRNTFSFPRSVKRDEIHKWLCEVIDQVDAQLASAKEVRHELD